MMEARETSIDSKIKTAKTVTKVLLSIFAANVEVGRLRDDSRSGVQCLSDVSYHSAGPQTHFTIHQ
jgi:hypothetical protein